VYEIVKRDLYSHIAVANLFDSSGFSPLQSTATAGTQSSIFHGIDRAALLESLRRELSSSQFEHLYGSDPASDLSQTGYRSDLPVVAEERSDDEGRGAAFLGDVDEIEGCSRQQGDLGGVAAAAGRVYSCDHCHCSVCKRSLESHECQRSVSSSSEREVMTDDAGGSIYSSYSIPLTKIILTSGLQ